MGEEGGHKPTGTGEGEDEILERRAFINSLFWQYFDAISEIVMFFWYLCTCTHRLVLISGDELVNSWQVGWWLGLMSSGENESDSRSWHPTIQGW